jgi:cell shape-determining protein MreD
MLSQQQHRIETNAPWFQTLTYVMYLFNIVATIAALLASFRPATDFMKGVYIGVVYGAGLATIVLGIVLSLERRRLRRSGSGTGIPSPSAP